MTPEEKVEHEINMLRGEMRSSFAALERRVQGTAPGTERHTSDPPRGYTLPMTPTGRVLLDEVQDQLDLLQRERAQAERDRLQAERRATLERELSVQAATLSDIRLRRWTSILSVLIGIVGLLAGLLGHYIGK